MTRTLKAALDLPVLHEQLEVLEKEWLRQGIPLQHRSLESFQEIYGSVLDEEGRSEFFGPITLWYINKYGEKTMEWDGVLARVPVLLRGKLYLVRIPFVAVTTAMKLTDRFEDLPTDIAESFSREEFDRLGR